MGLFHKTIQDMKNMVEQGRYDDAKRVLDEHISAHHGFNSNLTSLMRASAAFQQQLMNLQGWWSLANDAPKTTESALPTFRAMVKELEGQLVSIKYLMQKLIKEEKVKLE